jgi:hypothetical protein
MNSGNQATVEVSRYILAYSVEEWAFILQMVTTDSMQPPMNDDVAVVNGVY